MTSSEIRLHSGESMVGFEMVGELFVNLAFKYLLERQSRIDIGL